MLVHNQPHADNNNNNNNVDDEDDEDNKRQQMDTHEIAKERSWSNLAVCVCVYAFECVEHIVLFILKWKFSHD